MNRRWILQVVRRTAEEFGIIPATTEQVVAGPTEEARDCPIAVSVVHGESLHDASRNLAYGTSSTLILEQGKVVFPSEAICSLNPLRPGTFRRGAFPRPMMGGASRAGVRRGAPRLDPLGFAVLADRFSHSNSDDRQRNQDPGTSAAGERGHD